MPSADALELEHFSDPEKMPDWTAPFHTPVLTDEQYAKQKAEYTAKYGHTITIPGLSDIIKIRTEAPMTALENYWWKKKQWDKFGPVRLEEVGRQKQKRKDRYLAMLASPTPAVAQNAGSIMCAIDDAQDAISTLACIGQVAKKIAPRFLGPLLRGPVGMLSIASDCLNMAQQMGMYCMAPMYGKRESEKLARGSPGITKTKLKKAFKTQGHMPRKADWIQGLQTTEQVFGYGICLGPLMGLAQDIFWGSVRARPGKFVDIKFPVPDFKPWVKRAQRIAKSLAVLFGTSWETDDEDILLWTTAAQLSFQTLFTYTKDWNPLDALGDVTDLEVQAPIPWHPLTQEVIEEGPVPPNECLGWPPTNQLWSTIEDLMDMAHRTITDNMEGFYYRNNHSYNGWFGGLAAQDATRYALACLEGEDDVTEDFNVAYKAATTMIINAIYLDPNQPPEKFALFNAFLEDCEETLWNPTIENIIEFCTSPWNDIRLIKQIVPG